MQPAAFKAVAVVKFIAEVTQASLERDRTVRVAVSHERPSREAKVLRRAAFSARAGQERTLL